MTPVFLFRVMLITHFFEMRPLTKFLHPILDWEAKSLFNSISRGKKDQLKSGIWRCAFFISWWLLKYCNPCSIVFKIYDGMSKWACIAFKLSEDSFLFIEAPVPGQDKTCIQYLSLLSHKNSIVLTALRSIS
jgi:hypothetical protein